MMNTSRPYYDGYDLHHILSRLEKVTGKNGKYMACCPAHADRTPSLSICIDSNDGRVLIHCFAGCTPYAICDALGISLADLFPERYSVQRTFKPLPCWTRPQYEDVLRYLELFILMFENAVSQFVPVTEQDIDNYLIAQTRRRKVQEILRHA